MQEYLSEAIVLNVQPNGDMDLQVSLFTKKFGKLIAKAKSARKITSKLAGHLQPGNLARVRLIEKGGLQAVDVLKDSQIGVPLSDLYFLDRLLAEAEPDLGLWHIIAGGKWSWRKILKILGWDPAEAVCRTCRKQPAYFYPKDQEFFCVDCASKLSRDGLISVISSV